MKFDFSHSLNHLSDLPLFLLGVDIHEANELRESVQEVLAELLLRLASDFPDSRRDLQKVAGLVSDCADQVLDRVVAVLLEVVDFLEYRPVELFGPGVGNNPVALGELLQFLDLFVLQEGLHIVTELIDEGQLPRDVPEVEMVADILQTHNLSRSSILDNGSVEQILKCYILICQLNRQRRLL